MDKKPIRSLADLAALSGASEETQVERVPPKPDERVIEIPPISRAVLDALNPPKPPPPISIRLEALRSMDDDALMKWLTTESEFPGRALDEGTKMAITLELMRRQAAKFDRPVWWKDRHYWVALVAAIGGVIAATPIVWGWLTK